VVYRNEFLYSTQYLRRGVEDLPGPYFSGKTLFNANCRVCRMGTREIPFHDFDDVWVVDWSSSNPESRLPSDFVLIEKADTFLTSLDKFQFKYFTPIYTQYPSLFKYRRLTSESTGR